MKDELFVINNSDNVIEVKHTRNFKKPRKSNKKRKKMTEEEHRKLDNSRLYWFRKYGI